MMILTVVGACVTSLKRTLDDGQNGDFYVIYILPQLKQANKGQHPCQSVWWGGYELETMFRAGRHGAWAPKGARSKSRNL